MAEQRYQAVLAVISDGLSVSQAAQKEGCRVRRCTRGWPAMRTSGPGGVDRSVASAASHVRIRCRPAVEAALLELRRSRPYWGPERLVFELAKRQVAPLPSESAAYRALVRAQMIIRTRDRRSRKWKRWERAAPMELWQMDVVGGFPIADGTSAKALTGIDDHSRMCVCARLMARERTRAVCDGLRAALAHPRCARADPDRQRQGVHRPVQPPPVEVLFDAICRENGIEHLLTQPRSPTTTGKIERFHRSLRAEFLSEHEVFGSRQDCTAGTRRMGELLQHRPATSILKMDMPAVRFTAGQPGA